MKKTIFLYSGEGTRSEETGYDLLKSSRLWSQIDNILSNNFSLKLDDLASQGSHTHVCPASPLLTVTVGICLSDIWKRWGYTPDAVAGHSVGELVAAYEAGLYTLEDIIRLTYEIANIAAKLDGAMYHGLVDSKQIQSLAQLSSRNFPVGEKQHVTVSCLPDEVHSLLKAHPDFIEMKPPHPWHHEKYSTFSDLLPTIPSRKSGAVIFVSGVTTRIESSVEHDHWHKWLTKPIDFISTMSSMKSHFSGDDLEIIEIGSHPVLKQCCETFESYSYVSSMYRGEDERKWIQYQRRQLDPKPFIEALTATVADREQQIDFESPLAYQGFTSLGFVELAKDIELFFPGLAPQDFYRYKTIRQLIDRFGSEQSQTRLSGRITTKHDVVVAGMSCRFPASIKSPSQFWDILTSRKDQVGPLAERGDYEAGFLDSDTSRFDHHFFGISEAEAKNMDPQQILALELTELLFRDSGIDPGQLERKRVGVYIGVWNEEYKGNRASVFYPTGTNPSIIASRISYHFDFRGPSWVANTACSSSHVAVHYACKDIETGRIDFAIAGGVNMLLGNEFTHSMRDSGFLAKDGRCKTFDDSANGYVRAEGGGLILLAKRDLADKYYALIRGSSINQNGGLTQVITAPHPEAQEELILDACSEASITPHQIAYVECHGTGTKIGDPIEISALQNTVAKNRKTPCYLGSVKSNIGHLESAAGIAGLIKAILALNKGVIPVNLHFSTPNKFIDFDSYNLKVVNNEQAIDHEAFAGVSSFGFGGANAHIILQGAPEAERKPLSEVEWPFNTGRAMPITNYFPQSPRDEVAAEPVVIATDSIDVRQVVERIFTELTGVGDIDPDVELTEQGLDSLSATEFVSSLEKELQIGLGIDVFFDNPFLEQLIDYLNSKTGASIDSASTEPSLDRDAIAKMVSSMFHELTSVDEINPDVELTAQGLDSLSATQLISQLQTELKVEIDTDILFEYPLFDQLVDEINALSQR